MTPRKCPYPGCGGLDFAEMRPLYRFEIVRGKLKREQSGWQIICLSCFQPSAATDEGLTMVIRRPEGNGLPQAHNRAAGRTTLPQAIDLGPEP